MTVAAFASFASPKSESSQVVDLFPDMKKVAAIILGGGRGTRLFPLTQACCKPAIFFGGHHRLIDIPISNSINSGCHKIFLITQFLSSSLHQHIFRTYGHLGVPSGFLELLSAEQRPSREGWFQGTADAVRQNIEYIMDTPVDYFLILSGDQLYTMNYLHMLQFAKQTDADLVIAALPIFKQDAKRMGILRINEDNFITDFCEKPQDEAALSRFGFAPSDSDLVVKFFDKPFLGSMGIYLFKREALFNLLKQDLREDFGKHLIPTKVSQGNAAAYIHRGYWEDIGTIESFYKANMDLTKPPFPINFYDENWPIFSSRPFLQGPKIFNTHIENSIISEGCLIEAKEISGSILGPRCVIHRGCIIRDTYIFGHDFYTPPIHAQQLPSELHIGENCIIKKAILDKHVRLGKEVQLINKNKFHYYNGENIYVRDGIIIVPRGVSLPDGFTF